MFNGSISRLRVDSLLRSLAGISRRRHHRLRTRGAGGCGDHGRGRRCRGRHDPRGLVGLRHGDHFRCGGRCGWRVIGSFGARKRVRSSRIGRDVALWLGRDHQLGLDRGLRRGPCGLLRIRRDRCFHCRDRDQGRRGAQRCCQRRPIGNGRLDRCLRQWLRDRRSGGRLRGDDRRRHQHDAQIGRLDPPLLPRETQARKPPFLTTEGQAQQQRVSQQREQQCERQSPVFSAHALSRSLTAAGGSRGLGLGWPCRCTSKTLVSRILSIASSTPVRLRR